MPDEEGRGHEGPEPESPPVPEAGEPVVPPYDPEAGELDMLLNWLDTMPTGTMVLLAEHLPKPVTPKQRKSRDRLVESVLNQWELPQARPLLLEIMEGTLVPLVDDLRQGGIEGLLEYARDLSAPAALYLAGRAGLDPAKALSGWPRDLQEQFAQQQELAQEFLGAMRRDRRRRQEVGEEASRHRLVEEVSRVTRNLRYKAEQAQEDARRAQSAAESVARTAQESLRQRERELALALERVAELEAQVRGLMAEIMALREAAAAPPPEPPEPPERPAAEPPERPLVGRRVLVVGDEGRQSEYRAIIEELGGEFAFLSGYGNPNELKARARSADLICFVTAWASHRMWLQAKKGEGGGAQVVPVPQAGALQFRRAVAEWARRQASGRTP